MRYPPATRLDVVEDLHGHRIPDPYRWLEDPADPDTVAWSQAQDELCTPFLASRPARGHFADRIRALMPGVVGLPAVRGDRAFYTRRAPDQEQPVYVVREADGTERVLVDPNQLSADATITLDATDPSPDGRLLAYQLSEGGDEESVLRVLDVATGEVVDGPIDRCRYSPVAWLPDGTGFYYVRKLSAAEAPDGDPELHRRVRFHALGADPAADALVFGADSEKGTYFSLTLSSDGRWLVIGAAVGTAPRNDLWLLDREAAGAGAAGDHGALRPIVTGVDAETYGRVMDDGRLWLTTTLDAPRGRLVVADTSSPEPPSWSDVLPQSDGVLTDVALTDDSIVAVRTVDVVGRVEVHDRQTGAHRHHVELPGLGDATVAGRLGGIGGEVWIGYTDFVTPFRVLHHDVAARSTTVWATPPGDVAVAGIEATQRFFESADGTRVPMFVLAGSHVARDGRRPTILYGYGGFNVAMSPAWSASIAAWVEAGGVYAIANLRGGSEYGEEWHRAGMRDQKQNVFDDFFAAAECLIADGWTSPDHLGISGGSNGGLLVGAALTQRPELFRSVVCSAPLLDMVRYERFGLGQTWNDEYGRADDPTELGWLLSYSPYHRALADGSAARGPAYPAVLFTVFESDTRVDPLHARKLAAALQWATSADPGERPVLVRRETDVGHGQRSVGRTVALAADQLAFHAWALGLEPAAAAG